ARAAAERIGERMETERRGRMILTAREVAQLLWYEHVDLYEALRQNAHEYRQTDYESMTTRKKDTRLRLDAEREELWASIPNLCDESVRRGDDIVDGDLSRYYAEIWDALDEAVAPGGDEPDAPTEARGVVAPTPPSPPHVRGGQNDAIRHPSP
ncbi:MAG: hypothetical protein M3P49_05020, partial [Actinomycetota bacterium]|nr:hypothetical protein [Actinomycetota bacterium]